jgi:hypothetical protein
MAATQTMCDCTNNNDCFSQTTAAARGTVPRNAFLASCDRQLEGDDPKTETKKAASVTRAASSHALLRGKRAA